MDWVRGEKLGCGSFGSVNLAVPRNQSSQISPLMAVKSCGASHAASLMNEKLVLDELRDCPEIIGCFGESFSYENGEKLYNVLLEYASGGTLADKMKNSRDQTLPESEVRCYTKAMLKGLLYIHKIGYVHCDIKLQNILLCANGGVKIADFGLAKKVVVDKGKDLSFELRGTPLYMSPEMVAGGDQGYPADIWALGCVVAEMVTGKPVWQCSDFAALLMRIGVGNEAPEVPANLSVQGKDFLEKCFVKDPSKRWTAEMLLNHPFVANQDFDDTQNVASTSPRCPFDFTDWASSVSSSTTCFPSPDSLPESELWCSGNPNMSSGSWSILAEERLQGLFSHHSADWPVSDDWITIR